MAAVAIAGLAGAGGSVDASAFSRSARASDELPASLKEVACRRAGRVIASRRVATYDGGPNRRGRVYIYKTSRGESGYWFVWRGAGGGCSPGPLFQRQRVVAGAGQFLAGIAADEVTRIVVVGSRGVRHRVPLSADNGFIYDCRTYNGCPCAITWLDAYAGDKRVHHQNWLGMGCSRKRR